MLRFNAPHEPFRWTHVQSSALGVPDPELAAGMQVSSLSMDFKVPDMHWRPLEDLSTWAQAAGDVVCCAAGGGLVLVKGHVLTTCPQEHDLVRGRDLRIARLPEGLRPSRPMQFAALSMGLQQARRGGPPAHLVTLVLTPDGWIRGLSTQENEGVIDLSAIRFSLSAGILITDDIRLHVCTVGASRIVVIQGSFEARNIAVEDHRSLANFPPNCRPPCSTPFVVSGARSGGFHLVVARPASLPSSGGSLRWADGVWKCDALHLSGVMYEVAEEALRLPEQLTTWTAHRKCVVVGDFQRLLRGKFGSLDQAWVEAFDVAARGYVDFSEFCRGCKAAGWSGNATKLWNMLDEDGSGEVSMDEVLAEMPDSVAAG